MAMVKERAGRPIISAEFCISAKVLAMISKDNNDLEPLKLESSEGVSLWVEFHTRVSSFCRNLDFYVQMLVTSGLSVEVDVTLRCTDGWSRRTEPAIKKTLTENGLAGSVPALSSCVKVKVEVYTLIAPRSQTHILHCGQTVLKKLNDARVQGHFPDVVLTLKDAEFPAHRAVLAANSPVFLKMFSGDYKEAKALKKTQSGDSVCEVAISDFSKEAVELFLTLMYQGQADDWAGLEVELLEIADYYMVTHVKKICESRLMGMDGPTALGLLQHADKPVISSELRVRAVQAVARGWKQLSITPQWHCLQKTNPVLADSICAAQQLMEPRTTS